MSKRSHAIGGRGGAEEEEAEAARAGIVSAGQDEALRPRDRRDAGLLDASPVCQAWPGWLVVSPDLSTLLPRLKESEGWREHAYIDTTAPGHVTIGYGFNIGGLVLPPGVDWRDVGISPVTALPEALGEAWLMSLVLDVIEQLNFALPWVKSLDEVRQNVLAELAYNLGLPGLLRAPIFLAQVQRGEYMAAAENLRGWLWVKQVGPTRSGRLIGMMASGRA